MAEFTARRMAGYGAFVYAGEALLSFTVSREPERAAAALLSALSWLTMYLVIRAALWIGARYRIVRKTTTEARDATQ